MTVVAMSRPRPMRPTESGFVSMDGGGSDGFARRAA
jgi:hypothetical protein